MRLLLVGALAVASFGCDRLFGLQGVVLDGDAMTGDASRKDAARDDGPHRAIDATPDATVSSGTCPPSYQEYNGRTYKLVVSAAASLAWTSANDDCLADQDLGFAMFTHLVVMDTDVERSALTQLVNVPVWTGLTNQVVKTTFKWVTDEVTSYPPASGAPWASMQPNPALAGCVEMDSDGTFDVLDCSTEIGYVCECDAFPDDPTNYQ